MKKEISQVAYQKLENNKTKLTVERLFETMEILKVSIEEVFEIKPQEKYVQNNEEGAIGFQQKEQIIENYYQDNKEKNEQIKVLYEQRLQDKDKRIEMLKKKNGL